MTQLHWVLFAVIVLLVWYFGRCVLLIRSRQVTQRLAKLRSHFEREIQSSVAQGRSPDWLYYTDEASREHEAVRESLRTYGTIALATGVGGTMLTLVLYLLSGDTTTTQEPLQQLLNEMGTALVASVLGVVFNVMILWLLLPLASRRFDAQLADYLRYLRNVEAKTAATPPPAGGIGDALGARIGAELKDAIARVPELFERLETAATELGRTVGGFEKSVTTMTSVAGELSTSVTGLAGVPRDLETVLEQARSGWAGEVGRVLDAVKAWEAERLDAEGEWRERAQAEIGRVLEAVKAWEIERRTEEEEWRTRLRAEVGRLGDQQNEVGNRLINATADVVESVRGLPSSVAQAVDRISESLGRSFGNEARAHVTDLGDEVKKAVTELERHANASARSLQNHMTELMEGSLRMLRDVSSGLAKVLEGFPEHVASVTSALDEAKGKLKEVAEFLSESATGLSAEHEHTRAALAKLEVAVLAEVKAIEGVQEVLKRGAVRRSFYAMLRGWFGRSDNDRAGQA